MDSAAHMVRQPINIALLQPHLLGRRRHYNSNCKTNHISSYWQITRNWVWLTLTDGVASMELGVNIPAWSDTSNREDDGVSTAQLQTACLKSLDHITRSASNENHQHAVATAIRKSPSAWKRLELDLRQLNMEPPVPSVLWHCWLGGRKGIRPVKNRVVRCWRGYLSKVRCRLAYGPADATATHYLLLQ